MFISELTRRIHDEFKLISRPSGKPFDADDTFHLKAGSSRDLSCMQIQLLRYFGIAARFVSGYYFNESNFSIDEMHYWVEVYVPDAGWIEFDPSQGIMTGGSHIPICSSISFENTLSVRGSFRGTARSNLHTSSNIVIT
ncbi:MAG: transglutaminase-like domain-containing protein [Cyclobacteriaceae bacterium]